MDLKAHFTACGEQQCQQSVHDDYLVSPSAAAF